MTNHYHLLLTTPKGNLSRFMRHVDGVYTQRHNRYHKKDGHLFRGRYKAVLVQEDAYLTHLVRYIHLNPVQANLAQDPKDYPWSSHHYYLKAKDKEWLKVTETLKFFADSLQSAKEEYLDFIRDGIDPKTRAFFKTKKSGSIFGDVDFVEAVKDKFFRGETPTHEIPEARTLGGERMIRRIKKKVSGKFKVGEEDLCFSKRGKRNVPRTMAVALARELSGLHLAEIAGHFKTGSYKAVSAHHRNLLKSISQDVSMRRVYEGLSEDISK